MRGSQSGAEGYNYLWLSQQQQRMLVGMNPYVKNSHNLIMCYLSLLIDQSYVIFPLITKSCKFFT